MSPLVVILTSHSWCLKGRTDILWAICSPSSFRRLGQ